MSLFAFLQQEMGQIPVANVITKWRALPCPLQPCPPPDHPQLRTSDRFRVCGGAELGSGSLRLIHRVVLRGQSK